MFDAKTNSIYGSHIKYTPKEDLKPGDVFYLPGKDYPEYVEDLTTLKEDFGVFVGTSGHYGCDKWVEVHCIAVPQIMHPLYTIWGTL